MIVDAFNDGGSSLPTLPGRTALQERAHGPRGATGQVPGLPAHLHARSPGAAPPCGAQEAGAQRLPGPHEYPGDHPHLWDLRQKRSSVGWGKKRRLCPPSWTRSCPLKTAMCLNSMNSEASWAAKPASFGSGWPCAAEPARSWAGHSEIGVCKARVICELRCPRSIVDTPPVVPTGMPTPLPPQREPTVPAAKRRGKPATLSVGLAPCGQGPAAWCAAPARSLKTPRTISTPSICSSPTTTSPFNRKQRPGDYYRCGEAWIEPCQSGNWCQ